MIPAVPAVLDGRTVHHRRGPVEHRFSYRYRPWLVDIDKLPRIPRLLAAFRAQDHLDGGRHGGLRGDVRNVLAARGRALPDDAHVLMLAQPRGLGHAFNPLSVFWCLDASGTTLATILEVHNTYGGRHVYVMGGDGATATVEKAFYVSPFNDVSGSYRVRTTLSSEAISVSIALERDRAVVFSAGLSGRPLPVASRAGAVRAALRSAAAGWRTSALIRAHGIYLWLRRLPVQPRPPQRPGVST